MVVKYSKWPQNIPTLSFPRASKIYPNSNFWFKNKPSGNLEWHVENPFDWIVLDQTTFINFSVSSIPDVPIIFV
jgi:hypothetical protein